MQIEIIGAESLGVRSLCCQVTLPDRKIVIDPGLALGYWRHGLLPHPAQVAVDCQVRRRIVQALSEADDVVFSHFHGDHIPLAEANPYQLSTSALPDCFQSLRGWCPSPDSLSDKMRHRYDDLKMLMGENLKAAEGQSDGPLSFSGVVPHGEANAPTGSVMMTRIEADGQVFVHASDIQLLNREAVEQIALWKADVVLAAGPPLYLERLGQAQREAAWRNGLALAESTQTLILDHHLMRSPEGEHWLDRLAEVSGKRVCCAADFMQRPRRLLEANRSEWYEKFPVPEGWHEAYAEGLASFEGLVPPECSFKACL